MTASEKFALHLEQNYGVQLDFARHQALVREIEAFSRSVAPVESDESYEASAAILAARQPKQAQEKRNAKRRTR